MAKFLAISLMAAVSVAGITKAVPIKTKKMEVTDEEELVVRALIAKVDATDLIPNDGIFEDEEHAEQKLWFLKLKESLTLDIQVIEDTPPAT